MNNNSKEKWKYSKVTGKVEYFDKVFQDLPTRDKGSYRYLKITNYQFPFEIYEPNSETTAKHIDELKLADEIDVYYYETENTTAEKLNRFTQFIDKDGEAHFVRNGFQKKLGYIIIALALILNLMSVTFWKMGKLPW